MAYGLRYTCDFDSTITSYTLQIFQKSYAGSVTAITGGASVVAHTWETDDPKSPIKGSSLNVTLINEGQIPLTDLYSEDDEEFKVILLWGTVKMFEGFIIQDDSAELMVDYNHEITISANDSLGLLKDISFGEALKQNFQTGYLVTINSLGFFGIEIPLILAIGQSFEIWDGATSYGTYVVGSAYPGPPISYGVFPSPPVLTGLYTIVPSYTITPAAGNLLSLLTIIRACLQETGVMLNTRIFSNINETSQSNTVCFLEQILIDPQTFLSDATTYDNCYTVLEKILTRFNCTLFQSKGFWNIVRWDEARYYNYAVPGYEYDQYFTLIGPAHLDWSSVLFGGFSKFLIGIGETSVAETGLLQRITRPYKFTEETYNYKTPIQILRNFDLQTLGDLFNTVVAGGITKTYYNFPDSSRWSLIAGDNAYIVIETDNATGNELTRYVQQPVTNTNYPATAVPVTSLEFNDIEVAKGDKWDLSFSFRWAVNSSDYGLLNVAIFILVGGTPVYFNINDVSLAGGIHLGWGAVNSTYVDGFGNRLSTLVLQADDKTEWRQFSVSGVITDPAFTMPVIPGDGLMKIYVYGNNSRTGGQQSGYTNEDFQMKDIRFEYTPLINQSTKIIGQTHTSDQNTNTKNNEEHEIFIDNSPRNSIAGTLFLNSLTGVLQDRAGQWKRSYLAGDKNLGEITTFENLFLRRIPRTLLEGTFYGLLSSEGDHLNLLNVLKYTFFTDKTFIFGRLEIDYANNKASGTLYEIYRSTEVDADLASSYLFKYLYSPK